MSNTQLPTPPSIPGRRLLMTALEAKIVAAVWSSPTPLTRRQIAAMVGKNYRSFNNAALKRLVERGWLVEEYELMTANTTLRCQYSPPPMLSEIVAKPAAEPS